MTNTKSDTAALRVLIVEDDLDLREVMTDILTDEGYRVDSVGNGQDAVAFVKANPMPDLILMDLSLPEMSGEELMGHLVDHPDRSRAKIVVVSGWDDIATRAKDLQADGFMKKPLELSTISPALKSILQR